MLKWLGIKLRPARQINYEQVADLDAMLSEPVAFKLHGKQHVIRPLDVEQFMKLTGALTDIYALQKQKDVTAETLVDTYYALMHECCSSITREDIENMTQQQVAALFELVIETITGKLFAEKKKTLAVANQ